MSRLPGRVYGRNLQELYDEERGVPAVLGLSLQFLSYAGGLTTPALFKLTGDGRKTQFLKQAWDQRKDPLKLVTDTYAVAGALRLWLASLPDSLIPSALFGNLISIHRGVEGQPRTAALQQCLRQLPVCCHKTLYHLLQFLHHYRLNQRRVNLPATDIAVIFAPLLLRPLPSCQRSLQQKEDESHIAIALTDMLISSYRTLLSGRTPVEVPVAGGAAVPAEDRSCFKGASNMGSLGFPSGANEELHEMEELVCALMSDSTSEMLFDSSDMPFARALSSSFSSSSWSSMHSEVSTSDCSSPSSSTYSPGCLSPLTDSDSPATSMDGEGSMEWDAGAAPMMTCSDQALAPFLDAEEVCTSTPVSPAPWSQAGPPPDFSSLLPHGFTPDLSRAKIPFSQLSMEQLAEEKAVLKTQLTIINNWWEEVVGAPPTKKDNRFKPLYVRYWKLKRAIRRRSASLTSAAL